MRWPLVLVLLCSIAGCQTPHDVADDAIDGVAAAAPTDPRCDALCERAASCEGHLTCDNGGCVSIPVDTTACKPACASALEELEAEGDECAGDVAGWLDCLGGLSCLFMANNAFDIPPMGAPQVACLGVRESVRCDRPPLERLIRTLADAGGRQSAARVCSDLTMAAYQARAELPMALSCAFDSDCTEGGAGRRCIHTCGTLVNVASAAGYFAALDELEASRCPELEANHCVTLPPTCGGAPGPVGCVDGVCQRVRR